MKDLTLPQISFMFCKIAGFSLLGARWFNNGDTMGFLLMLFLMCMVMLRWRLPKLSLTVYLDVVACMILSPPALVISMFSAMYFRKFLAVLALGILYADIYVAAIAALGGLAGFFLGLWEKEREKGLIKRDTKAGRVYELEALQNDLVTATTQVERMTAVSERARIAREIHDNAGHEIVAAYISLQTAREVLDDANPDALALYDAALERLDNGANRIREAVHNLAPVAALGVEALQEPCRCFPVVPVKFNLFGNTGHVQIHVWSVLEACLNETLTNAIRHGKPRNITVSLDTTPHIIRLCIENDGITPKKVRMGNGLRNLRHRVATVGGSLTVDLSEVFRVICVIPIQKEATK